MGLADARGDPRWEFVPNKGKAEQNRELAWAEGRAHARTHKRRRREGDGNEISDASTI